MARTSRRRHNDQRVLRRRLAKRRMWAGRSPLIDEKGAFGKIKKYNIFWHCDCERCQSDKSHEPRYAPKIGDWELDDELS